MINFSTLQGLTIPEGVVTQITDESGRVLWAVQSGGKVILEVEKITSDTYAGETTYTAEEFILLDIYPKTNGTVNVTYGGLTKTIIDTSGAEEPNAQQVFFGTFNGVSDDVTTPASGELTIEGGYSAFGTGAYKVYENSKTSSKHCLCITAVIEWGTPKDIPNYALSGGNNLTDVVIPDSVTSIGNWAFEACENLTSIIIPDSVTDIGFYTFDSCSKLKNVSLPNGLTEIDRGMFQYCESLTSIIIPDGVKVIGYAAFNGCNLRNVSLPNGLTEIGGSAFCYCDFTSIVIPDSVKVISVNAFYLCIYLKSVTFTNPTVWYVTETEDGDISTGMAVDLSDPTNNATLIGSSNKYAQYYWYRK